MGWKQEEQTIQALFHEYIVMHWEGQRMQRARWSTLLFSGRQPVSNQVEALYLTNIYNAGSSVQHMMLDYTTKYNRPTFTKNILLLDEMLAPLYKELEDTPQEWLHENPDIQAISPLETIAFGNHAPKH